MTRGKFYPPKSDGLPNAFESTTGKSQLIKADPTYFKASKRGTSHEADSKSHITVVGKHTRQVANLAYNQVLTYPRAKPAKATASKANQRGYITSSANCWLGAILIAAGFALAQQLDMSLTGPADWQAAQAVAEEREALASREWAARQVCGHEGSYKWVADMELQCVDKHGRRTGKPQAVTVAGVSDGGNKP